MSTPVITIDRDAIDARLDHGVRWIREWGDYRSPTGRTCLHGAIRFCQPLDAPLIGEVGRRFGFGTADNDKAESWSEIYDRVPDVITDEMCETTFGPQWEHVIALVRQAGTLDDSQVDALADDIDEAAWWTARYAVKRAAQHGGRLRHAYPVAAIVDHSDSSSTLVIDGIVFALVYRDLIGQIGYTRAHYDALTAPWRRVVGPLHPDDEVLSPVTEITP